MVTFDKGARVPRLAPGVRLDDRQVGILLAHVGPGRDHTAELLEWDRGRGAATTTRMERLLDDKGPHDRQTLLLALSMSTLRRFSVSGPDGHFVLEGDRAAGYRVTDTTPPRSPAP